MLNLLHLQYIFPDMEQHTALRQATEAPSLLRDDLKAYRRFPQVQVQGCRAIISMDNKRTVSELLQVSAHQLYDKKFQQLQ